jgi:hypothetical protein
MLSVQAEWREAKVCLSAGLEGFGSANPRPAQEDESDSERLACRRVPGTKPTQKPRSKDLGFFFLALQVFFKLDPTNIPTTAITTPTSGAGSSAPNGVNVKTNQELTPNTMAARAPVVLAPFQ